MAWCTENLRDCRAWYDEGLPLTTTSNEAAKLYDCLMRQYVSWTDCAGGIERTRNTLKETHPEFLMGQILNCGLTAVSTATSILNDKDFKIDCDNMKSKAIRIGNEREKLHAKAITDFAHGNLNEAARHWEVILEKYPNDLLAAKFAHDTYFYLGDKSRLKETAEGVIRNMKSSIPCSNFLYGMYAFGLEECGEYEESEKQARLGLSLQPQDAWATHAIAHCMEMTGRYNEGIEFMESTVNNWEPCGMIACHNFWHVALYYIEKEDYESAMAYYDREIRKRSKSGMPLDIVDAASLLFRFEMDGVNVDDRWDELTHVVLPRIHDHILAFNDAHYRMVLTNCSNKSFVTEHQRSMHQYLSSTSTIQNTETYQIMKKWGERICESISNYTNGDYEETVQGLFSIRNEICNIGGSHAQRDIFSQLLIHSGINSPIRESNGKAMVCITERTVLKPNSPLSDRLTKLVEKRLRLGATRSFS